RVIAGPYRPPDSVATTPMCRRQVLATVWLTDQQAVGALNQGGPLIRLAIRRRRPRSRLFIALLAATTMVAVSSAGPVYAAGEASGNNTTASTTVPAKGSAEGGQSLGGGGAAPNLMCETCEPDPGPGAPSGCYSESFSKQISRGNDPEVGDYSRVS